MIECKQCLYNSLNYPEIILNEHGICNVCENYFKVAKAEILDGQDGQNAVDELVKKLKTSSKNKSYDCIIGISGGIDSCYLVLQCKKWGINPLLVHIDSCWNSEISVINIKKVLDFTGFDLYTYVLDWEQLKDLQLSFFKASVMDIDIPFDNAFMAKLFEIAKKFRIKYILTGHNVKTEGWIPSNYSWVKYDTLNTKSIHKKFGKVSIRNYPKINYFEFLRIRQKKEFEFISPLNWINFEKKKAQDELKDALDWVDYGGKHYENIFTRFYQGYILPEKFKIDKRISHLSSLICAGKITKLEAIEALKLPPYNPQLLNQDKAFFIKKMGITEDEFSSLMSRKPISHLEYLGFQNFILLGLNIKTKIFKK